MLSRFNALYIAIISPSAVSYLGGSNSLIGPAPEC